MSDHPPTASELDVLKPLERRIKDILVAPAFYGSHPEKRITVSAKDAEVIRSNIERGNLHPEVAWGDEDGFVCSLAGVEILEERE